MDVKTGNSLSSILVSQYFMHGVFLDNRISFLCWIDTFIVYSFMTFHVLKDSFIVLDR